MQWYIVKLVFRIVCGEGEHTPQFDEQLRLVEADYEEQAYYKALDIGAREQISFLNEHQQQVQWQFIDVPEMVKLNSLTDGQEIYSRVQEADDSGIYIDLVHHKSAHIRSGFNNQVIEAI